MSEENFKLLENFENIHENDILSQNSHPWNCVITKFKYVLACDCYVKVSSTWAIEYDGVQTPEAYLHNMHEGIDQNVISSLWEVFCVPRQHHRA